MTSQKQGRGKLIPVQIGPRRCVKMYEADAIAAGYIKKEAPQPQNKIIEAPGNKAAPPETKEVEAPAPVDPGPYEREDFTEIKGVGEASRDALYEHGIFTFDALAAVQDLSFLNVKSRTAIAAWQKSLEG